MKRMRGVPERVLVVEDDATLALMIEETMRDAGSKTITSCISTSGAMDALRRTDHDALILDVHLADRDDGWAIAELVHGLGANAPHIVFSTGTPNDIPDRIADLGVVLEKPYSPEELVEATKCRKAKSLVPKLIRARQ